MSAAHCCSMHDLACVCACAAVGACFRAMQLQTSLLAARRQLDELRQAGQQQQQQTSEVSQQLTALHAERSAAAEEAHGVKQELARVLRELEQCQKVSNDCRGFLWMTSGTFVVLHSHTNIILLVLPVPVVLFMHQGWWGS